ncbi:unnamed protein product [Coregonus sp. 'balchen']|nr:unnamed protein product [Coregonus sp. 'balchen']
MVQTLYSNGSNSIWEHCLLDPSSISSGKRKANPQDRVHPHKTEFIKAKYQMLAYVHRLPCREDDSVTTKDLSKQLHSSVRTGNLETCLRLLSLGAQANFFHPEKGNTPLHVAAKAGQVSQAELLAVYGADPDALDMGGKTPIDYARQAGHQELADRLVEIQYELTDRLAFYLCGRRPVWLVTQNHSTLVTDTTVVPFLPVNPEYSSTRNQAKDIELILKRISSRHGSESQDNEDQPDYDSVASDEDPEREPASGNNGKDGRTKVKSALTASETKIQQLLKVNCHLSEELRLMQSKLNSMQTEKSSLRWQTPSGQQHPQDLSGRPPVPGGRPMSMYETGSAMRQYPHRGEPPRRDDGLTLQPLPTNIGRGPLGTASSSLPTFPSSLSWSRDERARRVKYRISPLRGWGQLPQGRASPGWLAACTTLLLLFFINPYSPSQHCRGCSLEGQSSMLESDYDNTPKYTGLESGMGRNSSWLGDGSTAEQGEREDETEADSTLPCTEDVICKTEQITKNIQELLRAAQENKHERPGSLGCFSGLLPCCDRGRACLYSLVPSSDRAAQGCLSTLLPCSENVFVPCSERIHVAVREMATLFPKRPYSDTVRGSLRLLTSSASRLQGECQKATPHDPCPSDMQLVTQQVIQCAYDIAKAAKQLVTVTTKENSN